MGKKSPAPPQAPDPNVVAAAQFGQNANTALLQQRINLIDEYGPFGSSVFQPIGPALGSRQAGAGSAVPGAPPPPAPPSPPPTVPRTQGLGPPGLEGNLAQARGTQPAASTAPVAAPGAASTNDIVQQLINDPNAGRYRQVTTLTPGAERVVRGQEALAGELTDLGRGQIGRISGNIAQPFSYEGLPERMAGSEAERRRVEDALYNRARVRLDERFGDEQRELATALANQGIPLTSEAYRVAQSRFDRSRNDAYQTAIEGAIGAGGAEQSRLFGLSDAARNAAIQERLALRNQPINELAALLGTSPAVATPQFQGAPAVGVSPTDITGPIQNQYLSQLDAFNRREQSRNATRGALFGLGGSLLTAGLMPGGFFGLGGARALTGPAMQFASRMY